MSYTSCNAFCFLRIIAQEIAGICKQIDVGFENKPMHGSKL
jgi:hypothetical protein